MAPPLRERALAEIDKVTWTPAWGRERIHDMIAERPDWCISRQRFWGVPLIVFYCEGCRERLMDFVAVRHVLSFFEKEGADAWYTHPAEELLPAGTRCAKCGGPHGARRPTFSTCGSIRAQRIWRCWTRRARQTRNCPGPPTCTSKAPTSIAAGSTAPC